MRIVTVLTSLGVGGAEKHALAVASRMAERGHAVAVLVLRPPVAEQWPTTIETVHLGVRRTPWSAFTGLLRARRFLSEFRPDVIHSHSFHANIFARLLRILAPRLTVVSTVHNVNEGGPMRMLAYRLTDRLSRRTVAVSQAAADRFIRLRAIPQKKCQVIANGIDAAEFAPDPTRRAAMRAAEGSGSNFIWLAVGRLVPAKDYPNLLRAFQQVREQFPDAVLWIAGAAHDASLLGVELGFMEHVRWLGLRRDMPAVFDAADGFVLASAWEGMPLALCEAMAMEKPFVATDVGGVRELAADTGILVPARNPAALADAMKATMRQGREERAGTGRAARARILRRFSVNAAADRWEALYLELKT